MKEITLYGTESLFDLANPGLSYLPSSQKPIVDNYSSDDYIFVRGLGDVEGNICAMHVFLKPKTAA